MFYVLLFVTMSSSHWGVSHFYLTIIAIQCQVDRVSLSVQDFQI